MKVKLLKETGGGQNGGHQKSEHFCSILYIYR